MKTTKKTGSKIVAEATKFTPVQIDWNDTCGYMDWLEAPDVDVSPITSIGHLIEERDDSYVLAMDVGVNTTPAECNGWSVIPKGCVKSIKELRRK